MKTSILILMFLCSIQMCIAQLPVPTGAQVVTDPTNLAQLKSLVTTGAEQTKKVGEQVSFLQQQKENLEKVNSYLRRANTVNKAVDLSRSIIDNLNKSTHQLNTLSNLSPKYMSTVISSMGKYYADVTLHVSNITAYLADGGFKMSDAERLELINKELDSMQMVDYKIKKTFNKANQINSSRNLVSRK